MLTSACFSVGETSSPETRQHLLDLALPVAAFLTRGRPLPYAFSSTNDANGASVVRPVKIRPSSTDFSRSALRSTT